MRCFSAPFSAVLTRDLTGLREMERGVSLLLAGAITGVAKRKPVNFH